MQRSTPLADQPQLSLIEHQGWREYRVDARPHAASWSSSLALWLDACLVLGLAYYWETVCYACLETHLEIHLTTYPS